MTDTKTENVEPKTSPRPSRHIGIVPTLFMSLAIPSYSPISIRSTHWRWARDCRQLTSVGSTLNREA